MEEKKDLITDDVIFLFFKYLQKCNIIQTLIKVYYNRIIETYAIHRWFIRNYINKIKGEI